MLGFRVDANEKIATGHLVRCMSIAQEFRKQGGKCMFFLAEDKETNRLIEQGFSYRVLNSDWNALEEETDLLIEALKEENINFLIVDSYQATAKYLEALNQSVPVLYIDDMAKEKYNITTVLHYSNWPDEHAYEESYQNSNVDVLVGMEYIPLRDEFRADSLKKMEHKNNTILQLSKTKDVYSLTQSAKEDEIKKRVLITTGGSDPYHISLGLLEEMTKHEILKHYDIDIIVGSMYSHVEKLEEYEKNNTKIHLHRNVKNMSDYMRNSMVAVSAGGTTLYELCACKVPTVCFSFADNQYGFTKEMGKRRIMQYAGDAREDKDICKVIVEKIEYFLNNPEETNAYMERMGKLVDGNGTRRITEYLKKAMIGRK